MLNVVSDLFISNLRKYLLHHKFGIQAKLPGGVIFPHPVFCLGKQLFAWHETGLYFGRNTTIAPVA